MGLRLVSNLDFTVLATEAGKVIASGSRRGNVLKCVSVSPEYQGAGLAAIIMTELVKEAFEENIHAFEIGIACIESQLKRSNITIIHFEKACELTGNEAFF